MKHTKGKWKIKTHKIGNYNIYTDECDSDGIADCWHINKNADEVKANAKLIAAAPDMLKALEESLRMNTMSKELGYVTIEIVEWLKITSLAQKAIKKATS